MNRLFLVMMLFAGFVGGFIGGFAGGLAATCFVPSGRIEDNIDLPFVNDDAVLERWTSVDFVDEPSQFNSERRHFGGDLYMKELKFLPGGKTSALFAANESVGTSTVLAWTKGVVIHSGDKTAARYEIKKIGDKEYLFLEWKSGDYTIRHMKPKYYALKK